MAARKPAAKVIREDAGSVCSWRLRKRTRPSSADYTTFILKGFTHSSQAEDKLGKEPTNGKCSETGGCRRDTEASGCDARRVSHDRSLHHCAAGIGVHRVFED